MKKYLKIVAVALLIISTLSFSCSALTQGSDYMYDGYNESYAAPSAYVAGKIYTGLDMGTTALNGAQDLYVSPENELYIVDTKNSRIVITDSKMQFVREIKEYIENGEAKPLNQPKGVYLGCDGLLYICDTGNKQIVALDKENNLVRKDIGDEIVAVNKNIEFKPEKIVMDKEKTIYVVDPNIYQGILQYDENLNFESFFAPNDVTVTASVRFQYMWKNFFSDEQNDFMQLALPAPYNNVFMTADNFIYTTATGVEIGDELKCLNAIGKNILVTPQSELGQVAFGDLEVSFEGTKQITSYFVDIHCDENGLITAIDQKRGRIFQYDKECNLVCIFGGLGKNKGIFDNAVSIEKLDGKYIVLDASTNTITSFEPTDYIESVYEALDYYNQGLYEESVDLWENILNQNNSYTTAYKSIGRAYMQQGFYKDAMDMLEKGNDKYFYSMALKEYRKEFTRNNMWWMVILFVVGLGLVVNGIKRLRFWLLSRPFPKKNKKKG